MFIIPELRAPSNAPAADRRQPPTDRATRRHNEIEIIVTALLSRLPTQFHNPVEPFKCSNIPKSMPSYRKVVEEVEYNTLPSPTKEGFAAAVARSKNASKVSRSGSNGRKEKTASSGTNDAASKTLMNETNRKGGKDANGKNEKQCTGNAPIGGPKTANSQQEVIEIESDEEEMSLKDLAKLKQSNEATKIAAKSRQVNGIESAKSTVNSSAASSSKLSSVAPAQPVQFTATANGNKMMVAPQVQKPYSANPLVRNHANTIINNIHNSLQQTMPTPHFPTGPAARVRGIERWSEHRIDCATTIEDLEAIRRRLLTLTNRVDLRLKEMNFLKAIGMTESADLENADKSEHTVTSEMIKKFLECAESNMSFESRGDGNASKRKRTEDNADNEQSTKRQRFTCCPFCLNANTPRETDEVCTCSICDEKSNICSQCRGYCIKCNRLACEDCLMRCDTCFSDTYCSDCMPESGQCAKCIRMKPNSYHMARYYPGNTIRATTHTEIPIIAKPSANMVSGRNISAVQPLRITKSVGNSTPPSQTTIGFSIHRYIITGGEQLGLGIKEVKGGVKVQRVHANGYGEMIGIKDEDMIHVPFNNCSIAVKSCE